jgi:hypothetical protein
MIEYRPGVDIELARQQWRDGSRRIERARADPALYAQLHLQVELVIAQLRRRVGQTFTLSELAETYARADDWARFVLDEADPEASPPPDASTVTDAAFHTYARGASDYAP